MFNISNITTMYKIRLRKAMGGINTDEKMIIEIFCNHTFDQVANKKQYLHFVRTQRKVVLSNIYSAGENTKGVQQPWQQGPSQ